MAGRASPWAAALLLAPLALWVGAPRGAAQSQAPQTTVEGLTGEQVVIFFRGLPHSGDREIIQVHGKVHASTAHGVWLDPTKRYLSNKKEEAYEGSLYIPWTSISYARVMK